MGRPGARGDWDDSGNHSVLQRPPSGWGGGGGWRGANTQQPCLADVNSFTVTELLRNPKYEWANDYGTWLQEENRRCPDGRVWALPFSELVQDFPSLLTAHWGEVVWVSAPRRSTFPSITCVSELLNPRGGASIWKQCIMLCLLEIFCRGHAWGRGRTGLEDFLLRRRHHFTCWPQPNRLTVCLVENDLASTVRHTRLI